MNNSLIELKITKPLNTGTAYANKLQALRV